MFSQRKTEVSYGNTIPRNFLIWYVEEKLLESMKEMHEITTRRQSDVMTEQRGNELTW
jgi:hypothetical protein